MTALSRQAVCKTRRKGTESNERAQKLINLPIIAFFHCLSFYLHQYSARCRYTMSAKSFVILGIFFCGTLFSQTTAELEQRLPQATSKEERWDINYKLARNALTTDLAQAEKYAAAADQLATELADRQRQVRSLMIKAEVAWRQKNYPVAAALYSRARETAAEAGMSDIVMQAVEKLEETAVQQKDYKAAFEWNAAKHILIQERSRRNNEELIDRYEEEKKALIEEKKRESQILMAALATFAILLTGLYYSRQKAYKRMTGALSEKKALIEDRRRRSEQLLHNILPKAVAAELTVRNKVAAQRYEHATVMFIDFVDFTLAAEKLSPETLVEELDYCFSRFDDMIGRFRIEKIKTVGDAYICACGLTDGNEHPKDMIRAALQMQAFLQQHAEKRIAAGRAHFRARIGIHFGPVVAGVVGAKKFAYDIWGDTVNIAARMEQACEPGRVNVSGSAYEKAREYFQWDYRGKIAAKNKSEMDMYYVLEELKS